METDAKTHVNDSPVESMPNVRLQILLSVCVKPDILGILSKDVLMMMNALMRLVLMELIVLIRREDTNAYALKVSVEILIKESVFWNLDLSEVNANHIKIAHLIWLVMKELVSALALVCCVALTLSVKLKTTRLGVDAGSDLLKDQTETVFLVS